VCARAWLASSRKAFPSVKGGGPCAKKSSLCRESDRSSDG
jgi:hypothetical protein